MLVALTLVVTTIPGAAAAEEVSTAEFVSRIDRAIAGNGTGLRAVTAVDGTPVDGDGLLDDDPETQQTRLETLRNLIRSEPGTYADATQLQEQAEAIVSNPPYSAEPAGDTGALARIFDFLSRLFGNEAGRGLALLIVALITLAIAIPVLNRIAGRRPRRDTPPVTDPAQRADYQAAAREAVERGEFTEAVRMLFLDGVEHLESSRAVPDAGTTSTATVRRITGNEPFLDRFDEIAYGGSPAGNADVDDARSGWQRLKRRVP